MRIYEVKKLIDTVDYLYDIANKEETVVVECNRDTALELSDDCGFTYDFFDINDELDDYEFEVYIYNLETNSFYDSPIV